MNKIVYFNNMLQENETISAIETLLEEYITKAKSLTDVSLEFKQDILAKLNHREFILIKEDIYTLFNNHQSIAYSEVLSSFKATIEAFNNSKRTTVLKSPLSASMVDNNFYSTEAHKDNTLTLDRLYAGKLIDERYELIEKIGSGGIAVVWKALDKIQEEARTSDDQLYVAIKFIDPELDKDIFANTVREANRTRSLKHNNIINILTVGKTSELLFIVMELLQGYTLSVFIREQAENSIANDNQDSFIIPYELGMEISSQLVQALAYAHQSNEHKKGILHLDLKPDNVFYNPDNGIIKVLDFGLARYASKEDDEKTVFKGIEGLTTSYASPEMLRRFESDNEITESHIFKAGIEDDVFSLACIIYELFSGKRPFGSLNSKQAEEVNKQLVPLRFKKNQWQALAKALAFKRKKRTANVDTFLNEFINAVPAEETYKSTAFSKLIATLVLITVLFFLRNENFFSEPGITPRKSTLVIESALENRQQIINTSHLILKLWTVVNNENRQIIELSENTHNAVEHFKIGDRLNISFLANKKIYLILVYIDSQLNMMIEPLPECCEANKTYDFRDEKPMTIGKHTGTDKIRILISKNKIDKGWIRLNDMGEIDEKYIKNKLIKYNTKEERYFINGKLDLIINK